MKTVALEIHDAGLLALDESGPLSDEPASRGYALLDGKRIFTGRQAEDRARLRPRNVYHRFWQELDSRPLPRPFPPEITAADLAHAHLGGFWRSLDSDAESVILTAPGTFSETRLGLVLGIARACEIPVDGMVDAAVAAASSSAAPRLLHLDVHLHRLVATELRRRETTPGAGDFEVLRRRVEVVEGAGLADVRAALARRFAALFVRATRFDPLHSAESEQELYRGLPGWLGELGRRESLEISMGEVTIEVTRDAVVASVEPFFGQALDLVRAFRRPDERLALLVTHRLTGLPGFEDCLRRASGLDWEALPEGASARGALRARDVIRDPDGESLPFFVRLPAARDARPVKTGEAKKPSVGRAPTHLVRDGLAYPITGDPFLATAPWGNGARDSDAKAPSCKIFAADDGVVAEVAGTPGVFLNGEEVHGRVTLAAGDRLRIGESWPLELQMIAVVE